MNKCVQCGCKGNFTLCPNKCGTVEKLKKTNYVLTCAEYLIEIKRRYRK